MPGRDGEAARTPPTMREVEAAWAAQEVNRDDVERIETWGREHPETWTGLRWDAVTPGHYIVLLTEPDVHRLALSRLVAHPDALRVQAARYSRAQLDTVWDQLRASVPDGAWSSMGPGLERVSIHLFGREGELAAALHERFDDAIDISLGAFEYPIGSAARARTQAVPRSTAELPGIEPEVVPDPTTTAPGRPMTGLIHLRNRTAAEVTFGSGHLTGHLIDPRDRVVNIDIRAHAMPQLRVRIPPRSDFEIRFSAATDSADPVLGPVLPEGPYRLVVSIPVILGEGENGVLVTAPVPVRIG